jgi:hypothetical protein
MNTPNTAMPAILFRERVLDDEGKPLADIPENWDLADSREPELLELGRGQLLITVADDSEFVNNTMVPGSEGQPVIRAVFTPAPTCQEFRMGDILTVMLPLGSISYQVLVTHGELPEQLPVPGEMCLVLRAELSLI